MKILLVHNDYGKYSGEEAVVDKMAMMLEASGHHVAQLRMSSAKVIGSTIGKIHGFVAGIHSPSGILAMKKALEKEKPDIVNIHNLYPFISPAALRVCKKERVPVVMTVHNFRLICPTGLFMRDNKPCELCLRKGNEWGCVKYNCENSLAKSIGYAVRNAVARINRYYMDNVDCFACITDFQRQKLIEAGFPAEKITVIPNSADTAVEACLNDGDYVAYSGRISREKGVDLIIEAARRNPDIPFRLAGAIRDSGLISDLPENVEHVGYLSGQKLHDFYANARFFVMASRWYEGFPMTILETARFRKPMIAPDHGGFTEIIGHGDSAIGMLTVPGDISTLSGSIRNLWDNPSQSRLFGDKAHRKLVNCYSDTIVSSMWNNLLYQLIQIKNFAYQANNI